MKILVSGALLAVIFSAALLWLMPLSPAPAPAPTTAQAGEAPPAPPPAKAPSAAPALPSDEVNYVGRLPSPADLLQDKDAAEGAIVSKIVQTRTTIAVTYTYDNGQTRVVSYRLLPSAAAETDSYASAPRPPAYMTAGPGAQVVYPTPAPIYSNNTPPYQQAVPSPYDAGQGYPGAYQPAAPVYYDDTPAYAAFYEQPLPVYGYYVSSYGYRYSPRFPAVTVRAGGGFHNAGPGQGSVGNHGGTQGGNRGGGRR